MFGLFKAALGFLSIIPTGRKTMLEPEEFGRFPAFYPAVGLVFGLLLYLLYFIFSGVLPPSGLAVLLCTLLIILNRGFHIDGLADAADALFSHKSQEQKLIIMKDSRQGTFGVLAIVLDVLLKIRFIEIVLPLAPWMLILWPVWGRLAASSVAVRSTYVRSEGGLGRWMVENSGPKELFQAALFGLVLSLFGGGAAILTALAAIFFGFFLTWVWKKSLGGVTGDLLGASIELCEIFTIILFYILIS
ncbi:adenosylcobinamide-GDP ribazoletransferase [Deltaproteobacteria bacterium Smac51]|nr:adenosylcobinamide-GDP ribazoletransferase [Deltaproteobacteria bacterium Smac51]